MTRWGFYCVSQPNFFFGQNQNFWSKRFFFFLFSKFVILASYTGSSSDEDDVNPREKVQVMSITSYNTFL